ARRRAVARSVPTAMAPASTFSITLSPRKGSTLWNVRARPARLRRCTGQSVMSTPSRRTRPWLGDWKPLSTLTSVVLPAPLGPISPTISPGRSARLTASIARRPWKSTVMSATSSREPGSGATGTACPAALDMAIRRRASRVPGSALLRHLLCPEDAHAVARLAVLDLDHDHVALVVDVHVGREG